MAWVVLKDWIAQPEKGEVSRVNYSEAHQRIPAIAVVSGFESPPLPPLEGENLKAIEFQLFDDDGELYYEGRLHDDDDCLNQMSALAWGEADAGCTTIKVRREDGKGWVLEIG